MNVVMCRSNGIRKVLVLSSDTDVLVSFIYHLKSSWNQLESLYMRLGMGKTGKTFPLHVLIRELDTNLIKMLPALHSLSGCDTTSKVGSKLACFKMSLNLELLEGFGIQPLTPNMSSKAEKFLLSCFPKSRDLSTFTYNVH